MSSPSVLDGSKAERHSVGYTLLVIGLAIAMTGLAVAYGLSMFFGHQAENGAITTQVVTRTLVGKQLNIPADWLREAGGKTAGFSSQVELAVDLPLGKNGAMLAVEITLVPLSQVRASDSLLDGVYLHQFMPNELSGPPGLVGKPLYSSDGYENETVWYDALSQNPFVAKCAAAPAGDGPANCLRIVALPGGIAAVYDFSADALYSWRSFDGAMTGVFNRIGALNPIAGN
jgi:hypothetical protein